MDALTTHRNRPMSQAKLRTPVNINMPDDVIAFFQGLGFTDPAALSGAIETAFCDVDSSTMPAPALLDHARRRTADWFAVVLNRSEREDDAILTIGRAAYLLTDAARRWPEHFLSEEPLPQAMEQALRRVSPVPVPRAKPTPMLDQPLDPVWAGEPLKRIFGWWSPEAAERRPA